MNYDHIFDSNSVYEKEFELSGENDKEITVFFEKERIVLTADKHGNAVFAGADGAELKRDKAEADRFFLSIYCCVKDGAINVRFPITETIDHYPNCDGEYDRYSTRIVDNIIISCPI